MSKNISTGTFIDGGYYAKVYKEEAMLHTELKKLLSERKEYIAFFEKTK